MEDGLAGEGSGISISHSHKVQAQALDTVGHAHRYIFMRILNPTEDLMYLCDGCSEPSSNRASMQSNTIERNR